VDSTRSSRDPRSANRRRLAAALAGSAVITLAVGLTTTATATTAPQSPSDRHTTVAHTAHTAHTGAFKPVADDTYYKDAEGKTGEALKTALHKIISSGVDKVTYDQVWDALKVTDKDPKNSSDVIELYTGNSVPADDNGGGQGQWNREHVWAKSHGDFGTAEGPGTDLHHLRPSDVKVNSIRGNKDFDNGGSAVEGAPGNSTDDDSFEPRDAVKGDVARMILYMAVRYEGDDSFPDLEPNDKVNNGSNPNIGRLSVLKKWSDDDAPDSFEKNRNEVIYDKYQHNRNPFIDHPEWVDEIW
jgi:endonuclease I